RRDPGRPRTLRRRPADRSRGRSPWGATLVNSPTGASVVELWVNGERRRVSATDVRSLLVELGLDPTGRGLAVARNGEVVPRGGWAAAGGGPGGRIGRGGRGEGGWGGVRKAPGGQPGLRPGRAPPRGRAAIRAARCSWTRSQNRVASSSPSRSGGSGSAP